MSKRAYGWCEGRGYAQFLDAPAIELRGLIGESGIQTQAMNLGEALRFLDQAVLGCKAIEDEIERIPIDRHHRQIALASIRQNH